MDKNRQAYLRTHVRRFEEQGRDAVEGLRSRFGMTVAEAQAALDSLDDDE